MVQFVFKFYLKFLRYFNFILTSKNFEKLRIIDNPLFVSKHSHRFKHVYIQLMQVFSQNHVSSNSASDFTLLIENVIEGILEVFNARESSNC